MKINSEDIYSPLKTYKLKTRKIQYITSNHLRYNNSVEISPKRLNLNHSKKENFFLILVQLTNWKILYIIKRKESNKYK